MVRWTERLPKNGAAEDQPSGGDLVRVFGGTSRIKDRPWQPTQDSEAKKRIPASRRQAIPEIERGLRYDERVSGQCGHLSGLDLALTRAATADLNRIVGLKYKGSRYRGHRKVQGDIEENGQENSAAILHVRILPDRTTNRATI
jgi:hypothetical protein